MVWFVYRGETAPKGNKRGGDPEVEEVVQTEEPQTTSPRLPPPPPKNQQVENALVRKAALDALTPQQKEHLKRGKGGGTRAEFRIDFEAPFEPTGSYGKTGHKTYNL